MTEYPIIELDSIDSTNNYAMQLIDANKAQHGMTITAKTQTAGKGQRGRTWTDEAGQSLIMSIIIMPGLAIDGQFTFSAAIAVAIANVLQNLFNIPEVHIKWPNDIIVSDKKAGGILIENVIRGSRWTHSVVGLGLNVQQNTLPDSLPYATSLKIATGNDTNITKLRDDIRAGIVGCIPCSVPQETTMARYNQYLYMRGCKQSFSDNNRQWAATLLNAHKDGTLQVQLEDGTIVYYQHGQVGWVWG